MENNKAGFGVKICNKEIWLSNILFPILVAMASSSIFAATHMYLQHGTGSLSTLVVAQMLETGVRTGDFAPAAGFAAGFLIARVLEGPLVGILDIGGSLMTGVGVGIPALMLSVGITKPLENFSLALITGAGIGLVIGIIVMLIRKLMPEGLSTNGTDVMMGAGNATGKFFGPLVILSAVKMNVYAGIGSIIGALIFYKFKKPIAGGAIIGAMVLGAIFI